MGYTKDVMIESEYIGYIVLLSTDSDIAFNNINSIKLLTNQYFVSNTKHIEKKNCVYLYVRAVLKEPKMIDKENVKSLMKKIIKELNYKSPYGKLYFTPIYKGQSQISVECGYEENKPGYMFK